MPDLDEILTRNLSRRSALKLGAVIATGTVAAACVGSTASPSPAGTASATPPTGTVGPTQSPTPVAIKKAKLVFDSTQLTATDEAEKVRSDLLAGFSRPVDYVGEEYGPFVQRMTAAGSSGTGLVDVGGGLHGDFAYLASKDLLADVTDLGNDLSSLGFAANYLQFAKMGGQKLFYIPWFRTTYLMIARKEALDHLPSGADINALTYDQWSQWGQAIQAATGKKLLGLPASPDSLIHRFFQGYSYPSFTGGLNTTFAGSDAVTMWQFILDTWRNYVNPQSTTYGFIQEPIQSGEVWVGWDHVARVIGALQADATKYVVFPAPASKHGRGYFDVVAGLAIPANAQDPDGSRELIKYLVSPDVASKVLQDFGYFPPYSSGLPTQLSAAVQALTDAIGKQSGASDALPSLLPIGLGDQGDAYSAAFVDTFQRIVLKGEAIATVLGDEKPKLQSLLTKSSATCWTPDPASTLVCQVN